LFSEIREIFECFKESCFIPNGKEQSILLSASKLKNEDTRNVIAFVEAEKRCGFPSISKKQIQDEEMKTSHSSAH